ncbi:hypothetical protein D0864_09228 [Hortaea werneckii]|uniref:TRP C-terminal domain-containing protein n=1 Tax=Hortaea werneckii TaxID=91943 RepID=A0A3M7EQG8_HORWE|nr:hypothetical protein D0864_09228 [Hortaea werneckii]
MAARLTPGRLSGCPAVSSRPPAAAAPTVKIAPSKSHHKTRSSLLGISSGPQSPYYPLSGGSFSSPSPQPGVVPPGGYHDRQGLPTTPAVSAGSKKSRKMYMPNSTWTWAFMLITIFQCLILMALEAYIFGQFQASLTLRRLPEEGADGQDPRAPSRTIPTWLAIFIFGFIYQIGLVWDALRLKNTIQVIGVCLYNLGMMIYSAVEMEQVSEAVAALDNGVEKGTYSKLRPFLIAAPCVLALGTVLLSFVAWKLYNEFAWTIYKHISADLRLKRRYLVYQIYIALLKFDFFFFLGFTVQFLVIVSETPDAERYITIAALPITVVLLILAGIIVRKEWGWAHILIILVYFAASAYFIFKLVRMWDASPSRLTDYKPARNSLTTFAVLTLLLMLVTITVACMCMANFGKGLRPHIQKRKVPDADEIAYTNKYGEDTEYAGTAHPLGPVPNRMTID